MRRKRQEHQCEQEEVAQRSFDLSIRWVEQHNPEKRTDQHRKEPADRANGQTERRVFMEVGRRCDGRHSLLLGRLGVPVDLPVDSGTGVVFWKMPESQEHNSRAETSPPTIQQTHRGRFAFSSGGMACPLSYFAQEPAVFPAYRA